MTRNVDGRVRRLDDWSDARYSIVSADAWRDPTLTETELRVLLALGSVNTDRGWCEASQTTIAKTLGCSRQTVSEACNALVRRRYLDVMRQTKARVCCLYRVLIDDPLIDAEAENAARDEAPVGVSAGGDTPTLSAVDDTPVSSTADTGVSELDDTGVSSGRHPPYMELARARSEIIDPNPLAPRAGGNSGSHGDGQWKREAAASLRASGRYREAVEHLLVPVLASDKRLALGRTDTERTAALLELAQAAHGIARPALEAAAKRLVASRPKLTPRAIRDEIDRARQHRASVMVRRGTPQHQRWVEHYEAIGNHGAVTHARRFDISVPSEWPPALRVAGNATSRTFGTTANSDQRGAA